MISSLPAELILATARGSGGDFSEIFVESSQRTTIVCDDNRLETVTSSSDAGCGIRVLHDTRTAYGSTNDISAAALTDLAASVGDAAAKDTPRQRVARSTTRPSSRRQGVKSHPNGIALGKKVELVERANHAARTADDRIAQVKITLTDHLRQAWIATSDGTEVTDELVYVTLVVQAVSADGTILQSSYEPLGGMKGYELFDDTTPEEIAAVAARRAITMLTAAPSPAGPMPVILAGEAGGTMIHEAVGHGLEADLAEEGLSVYKDRLGDEVASRLISLFDDATLAGQRGSFTFDDEGTPAQRTCLIEGGVLKTYLHNRVTATRSGSQPTGNGRRQSYAYPPIVRMTNTFIAPGQDDPAAIIRATELGLYVKKIGGGQVNTVNGDFVFDVQEGYRIEHGKIGEPVRGATLAGNGPKILQIIDKVGNDIGFSIGTCGKYGQEIPVSCGQPTIRIPEIIVGGTA